MKTKSIEEIVKIYCQRYTHLTELAETCKQNNNYHQFKVAVIQLEAPKGIGIADLFVLTAQ